LQKGKRKLKVMMKKLFVSVVVLFIISSCRDYKSPTSEPIEATQEVDETFEPDRADEDLIVGGSTVTKMNAISSVTVALLDPRAGALCTASLLSSEIAITAAHCVEHSHSGLQLYFSPSLSGEGLQQNRRSVIDVAISPRWSMHRNNTKDSGDIAILRFSGGFPMGYKSAELLKGSNPLNSGKAVVLAGYGINSGLVTDRGVTSGSGVLRSVKVQIADANFSKTEVSIDQSRGAGACHGDSGGPAFVQDSASGQLLLWGVTSRGIDDPKDHCSGKSVYTKIQPFNRWINQTIRKWNNRPTSRHLGT
jgi:hypothetical protein